MHKSEMPQPFEDKTAQPADACNGDSGCAKCSWCGGSQFSHGRITAFGRLHFFKIDSCRGKWPLKLVRGQKILARRCDTCGHLDLVALDR